MQRRTLGYIWLLHHRRLSNLYKVFLSPSTHVHRVQLLFFLFSFTSIYDILCTELFVFGILQERNFLVPCALRPSTINWTLSRWMFLLANIWGPKLDFPAIHWHKDGLECSGYLWARKELINPNQVLHHRMYQIRHVFSSTCQFCSTSSLYILPCHKICISRGHTLGPGYCLAPTYPGRALMKAPRI